MLRTPQVLNLCSPPDSYLGGLRVIPTPSICRDFDQNHDILILDREFEFKGEILERNGLCSRTRIEPEFAEL